MASCPIRSGAPPQAQHDEDGGAHNRNAFSDGSETWRRRDTGIAPHGREEYGRSGRQTIVLPYRLSSVQRGSRRAIALADAQPE